MNAVTGLRNQASESWLPSPDRGLGWWGVLPPITNGKNRWWLPLSDTALVSLSFAISASGNSGPGNDWDNPDSLVVKRVVSAFQDDPPLLLFALMRWPGDDFVSSTELAQWLIGFAAHEFSGGQWILSAPEMTNQHQYRWSRLLAQSRGTDPSEWIDHAAEWLQVLGPEVDPEMISRIPGLIWDGEVDSKQKLAGSHLLQRMARSRVRELVTEQNLSSLAEKRKNAAAKQLAYGLSHEINNPLANISARAQQLARDEKDPQRVNSLQQIVQQVFRAHEMIAGLMFFANPSEVHPERVDLNTLVGEVAAEFGSVAKEVDIRLVTQTMASPALSCVDRIMMVEAIRILVRNSIEAIGSGGTVMISTETATDESGDSQWLIRVADSGPGLSAEATQHAFDPFYSGREAGRGLGLGLCRAYRVAKLHNATIRLSGGLAGCIATIAIPK